MSEPEKSKVAGPVLAGIALLAAVIVYYGVSSTSGKHLPGNETEARTQATAGTFVPWSDSVWSLASDQDQLVFLLVSDSTRETALTLESQMLEIAELQAQFKAQVLPVRISRRMRPDLAERYAQQQVPVALLLLPSGEALSVLQGDPGTWPAQITQADRFRRDHRDEIAARVEKFWDVPDAPIPSSGAETPSLESQLAKVDLEIHSYVDSMLNAPSPTDEIWRVDIGTYLRLRTRADSPNASKAASQLLERLVSARNSEWPDDLDMLGQRLSPAGIAQVALEPYVLTEVSPSDIDRAASVLDWMRARTEQVTAAEAAYMHRLASMLGRKLDLAYPGDWLGSDRPGMGSLPHNLNDPEGLDGFLTDGLAWLECLIDSADPARSDLAQALADSIWTRLWSEERLCFRDKPIRPTAVRELEVFPRAQLGRAAMSYLRTPKQSDPSLMRSRAERCLEAFWPYLETAGSAAAYYGCALMVKSRTNSSSHSNSGT